MPITRPTRFKGRQYPGEVIVLCVRWYLRYPLAYEHVSEIVQERGVEVDASCIWRWVQAYAPELNKRCRRHLKATNKSYRVDETYIKVKGQDKYLYRAVDSTGQTIEFLLAAKWDAAAAKRFFRKALSSPGNPVPRVINVDKNREAFDAKSDWVGCSSTITGRRHKGGAANPNYRILLVRISLPGFSGAQVTVERHWWWWRVLLPLWAVLGHNIL